MRHPAEGLLNLEVLQRFPVQRYAVRPGPREQPAEQHLAVPSGHAVDRQLEERVDRGHADTAAGGVGDRQGLPRRVSTKASPPAS